MMLLHHRRQHSSHDTDLFLPAIFQRADKKKKIPMQQLHQTNFLFFFSTMNVQHGTTECTLSIKSDVEKRASKHKPSGNTWDRNGAHGKEQGSRDKEDNRKYCSVPCLDFRASQIAVGRVDTAIPLLHSIVQQKCCIPENPRLWCSYFLPFSRPKAFVLHHGRCWFIQIERQQRQDARGEK